jgi:ubiquinone/menaquinone biosynthesis C-methylase UbiE
MQRVNYDKIAHLYDEPGRDHILDPGLAAYLAQHPWLDKPEIRVLDVGCGTGKQLNANWERFPEMKMVGLDLFSGMLREARKRNRAVCFVQGDGAYLPFRNNSIHFAVNQFSYPHIQKKLRMIEEVHRVLKPGGWFTILHIDPWSMPDWILYRYFPASREQDYRDFLPVPELKASMERTGFGNVQVERERREKQEDLTDFFEYAKQRYRTSQLMVISDKDYQDGLAQINRELVENGGEGAVVNSELSLFTLRGTKG